MTKKLLVIACALATALLAYRLFLIRDYTMDDTFIGMRYAQHLAQGHGLSWNIGETLPVEGYTSILWVMVLSVFEYFGCSIWPYRILCMALIGAMAYLIYRHSRMPGVGVICACLLLSACDPAAAVMSGMETILAMGAFLGFCVCVTRQGRLRYGIALCAISCGLLRPELNLTVMVMLGIAWLQDKNRKNFFAFCIAPYLIMGAAYFLWRWNHYGMLLPLPAYAKAAGHGLSPYGIGRIQTFLISVSPLLPLIGWFWLVPSPERKAWLPVGIGVIVNIAYWCFPDHLMGWNHRYLMPMLPVLILMTGMGLTAISKTRSPLVSAGALLCCAAWFPLQSAVWEVTGITKQANGEGMNRCHVAIGKELKRLDPSGKSIVAVGDAGAIPYYSGWKTVDICGLNDRDIATQPRKGMDNITFDYPPSIVLRHMPDILILSSCSRLDKDATGFAACAKYETGLRRKAFELGYKDAKIVHMMAEIDLWIMKKGD